jgi:hypothetical protein
MTVYHLLRRVWPYMGPVVGFLGLGMWLEVSTADVISALRDFGPYVLSLRVTWLLVSAASFFFAYVEIRHRGIPLTAVKTEIEVLLTSPDGRSATVKRKQKLRANHENVTGYHRWAKSSGQIPKEGIHCSIDHCGQDKQFLDIDGDPSSWEIIHRFDRIPKHWWKAGLNTVVREDWMLVENSFHQDTESYEFGIPERYRYNEVSITIFFHPQRVPIASDCSAIWISDNGVTDLPLLQVPPNPNGHPGIRLKVKKPRRGDKFRVVWKYPQIVVPDSTQTPRRT